MIFQIPPDLAEEARRDLEKATLAGGPDAMPFPTQVSLENAALLLTRRAEESGFLLAPWDVPGFGRIMIGTATLMDRLAPYNLPVELARGKINRLRCQASEWVQSGLVMDDVLAQHIHQAVHAMGQTIFPPAPDQQTPQAIQALVRGCSAVEELVDSYVKQVFYLRHLNQAQFESYFSCRLNGWPLRPDLQKVLPLAFNCLNVHVPWRVVEPTQGDMRWQTLDEMVAWAQKTGLNLIGGPVVDFSGFGLPDWLWGKHTSLETVAEQACTFVDKILRRYGNRIHRWQLTAGSNLTGVVARSEEELLWLTYQILQTARRANDQLEWIIGLAQPWGDYMAQQECKLSPFSFADNLLRTEIKLAALDLEVVMGVAPRGSFCRDTLDLSKLLDLYAYLEVPLQVTMGYPSMRGPDPLAEEGLRVDAGFWRDQPASAMQADWAQRFGSLALCKPAVRGLQWVHLNDAASHQFPHCGLVDAKGNIKPIMDKIMEIRSEHLK